MNRAHTPPHIAQPAKHTWYKTTKDVLGQPGDALIGAIVDQEPDTGIVTGWSTVATAGTIWSMQLQLPFRWRHFGREVTSMRVAVAGIVAFDTTTGDVIAYKPQHCCSHTRVEPDRPAGGHQLPNGALPPRSIVAAFDHVEVKNGMASTKVFGSNGNRQLWIKWEVELQTTSVAVDCTWALVLHEASFSVDVVLMKISQDSTFAMEVQNFRSGRTA